MIPRTIIMIETGNTPLIFIKFKEQKISTNRWSLVDMGGKLESELQEGANLSFQKELPEESDDWSKRAVYNFLNQS